MTYTNIEEKIRKAAELACELRNQLEVISNEYNDLWQKTSDPEEETDAYNLRDEFQFMADYVSSVESALDHEDIDDIIESVLSFES